MAQIPSKPPPIGKFTWLVTRVMPLSLAAVALHIAYRAYSQPLSEEEQLDLVERRDPTGRTRELQASLRRRRDAHIAQIEAEKAEKALQATQSREDPGSLPQAAVSSESHTSG